MYEIIKDGKILALTDTLHFIKISNNGSYVEATEDEALGIAVAGIAYHLLGRESFGECETVSYKRANAGEYMFNHTRQFTDIESQLINTQLALCDVYELIVTV